MTRPDYARIRQLERWHTARDCEDDGGHHYPAGYDHERAEMMNILVWGKPAPIRSFGPPCTTCGTPIPA